MKLKHKDEIMSKVLDYAKINAVSISAWPEEEE